MGKPVCLLWSEIGKWTPISGLLRFDALPAGWKFLPLNAFAKQIQDREKVIPEKEYKMAGVKWYGKGVFHRETVIGKEQSANYLYPLHSEKIIYNRLFAWKESFAVVPEEMDNLYVSNEFPQFEIDEKIALPVYIYLLFTTDKIIQAVNAASIGSSAVSRNRFKESEFIDFKVPVPPLSVQGKIVEYWKNEYTKIKDDIALAAKISQKIPKKLSSELGLRPLSSPQSNRAFVSCWKDIDRWGVNVVRALSALPDLKQSPFPLVFLSDVIDDLQNGWSPKCLTRPARPGEWGVLKVGAVSFGWFNEKQNKALPKNLKPRKQYEVKNGDLIISRANITQYVGACAFVKETRHNLMLCDKLFRVIWKKNSPVLPSYLNEILKISQVRWQIENNLTGASPTMKNISKPALMSLQFPLPSLKVQSELVEYIEKQRNKSKTLENEAEKRKEEMSKNIEQMILGTRPVE